MNNKVKYDIINPNHYINLINKRDNLSDEETKQVQDFDNFVGNFLMKYEDYLLEPQKKFLNIYKRNMENLSFAIEDNQNLQLSAKQKYALEQYGKMITAVKEQRVEKIRVLQKNKNDSSLGFANAFVVVLAMLASGIIIGIILFSSIK